MHKVSLPPELQAELLKRRGGRTRLFEHLHAQTTALLVIDMQDTFVAPNRGRANAHARDIVPSINRLSRKLRSLGVAVVWVRTTLHERGRSNWPLYFDHFAPRDVAEALRASLMAGGDGHRFWHELEIATDDLIVDKDRFSAFVEGASNLEAQLRARAIDTIVITGTLTNVCCESTARDAMMRDFRCVMVEDATAAATDADHLAGLCGVARFFAEVASADDVIARFPPAP